jgi:hypothetical protein
MPQNIETFSSVRRPKPILYVLFEINDLISGVETYNTSHDVQVQRVYFLQHRKKTLEETPKSGLTFSVSFVLSIWLDQSVTIIRAGACYAKPNHALRLFQESTFVAGNGSALDRTAAGDFCRWPGSGIEFG